MRGAALSFGDGLDNGGVTTHLAQLFTQQKIRLAEQRSFHRQKVGDHVLAQRSPLIKGLQIIRDTATDEIRARLLLGGPIRKKFGSFSVFKRFQQDLCGAAPKERRFAPQNRPFHEAQVRAAQDNHKAGLALPLLIPELLEQGGQFRRRLAQPLEFIQHEHHGLLPCRSRNASDQLEYLPPVIDRGFAQPGLAQPLSGCSEKGAYLISPGSLRSSVVNTGLALAKAEDQFGLADAPPAINGNQGRARLAPGALQRSQFPLPANKLRSHLRAEPYLHYQSTLCQS